MPSSRIEPTPFTLERDGVRISGETAGPETGAPLLLLHGLTATRRYVLHGSRSLERAGRRTISYDARGHGATGGPPRSDLYDYARLIDDARAVLDHLGIERTAVAGHSMGSATALGLALTDPERVSALVVVAPAHRGAPSDNQARWDELADGLESGGVEGFVAAFGHPRLPGRFAQTIERVIRQRIARHDDHEALAAALRGITRSAAFDGLHALEAVRAPSLVVGTRDEADPDHPLAVAERYVALLPEARLEVEAPGESPLSWRGGTLSTLIESFLSAPERRASH